MDPRVNGLERTLEMKVNVRDDGDANLRENLAEGVRVLLLRNRNADNVRACRDELVDLGDARVDVVGVPRGHGLYRNGRDLGRAAGRIGKTSADADKSHSGITENNLTCWAAGQHGEG